VDRSSNLLIACALKKEAKGLKKHLQEGRQVLVTGLGVDRTLRTLEQVLEKTPPALLVFTGMCGQLDPELGLGDFVFPESWGYESGTEFRIDDVVLKILKNTGWEVCGKGLTVRRPVVRGKDRLRLFHQSGARICDMEAAAAMMISAAYGVPCIAPKIVSDTADSGMLAFYRNFGKNIDLLGGYISRLVDILEKNVPISP